MNIGLIKFGLSLHEEKSSESNFGFWLEIKNLINLFESRGHNVYIISSIQKGSKLKQYTNEKLDFIFVYNGPIGIWNWNHDGHKTLNMLERYTGKYMKFLNQTNVPWVYLQPDSRYNLDKAKDLISKPKEIITLKNGWFDKIYLLNRKTNFNHKKSIDLGLVYNDTNVKKTNQISKFINWIRDVSDFSVDLKGKFKNDMRCNSGILKESEIYEYWQKVKYTVNMANESEQITPRMWDCFMNDTISFLYHYDEDYKVIPKDHFLRIIDEIDLEEKMQKLENDNNLYKEILQYQRSLIKKEYLNGDFVYNKLIKKIS